MGDIVVFGQRSGMERFWVTADEEEAQIAFWHRHGCPAARWSDYKEWGGFFPPHPETVGEIMLRPRGRRKG